MENSTNFSRWQILFLCKVMKCNLGQNFNTKDRIMVFKRLFFWYNVLVNSKESKAERRKGKGKGYDDKRREEK